MNDERWGEETRSLHLRSCRAQSDAARPTGGGPGFRDISIGAHRSVRGTWLCSVPVRPQHCPRSHAQGGGQDVSIMVSNPTKEGDGMSSYMSYQVITRVSCPPRAPAVAC